MGSCVSVDKAMKPEAKLEEKEDKGMIISPVKEKPGMVNDGDPGFRPSDFQDGRGSKDEAFFDSQPWLDSDCENDYFSVNGDLTPSCGSTPVHHSFQSANECTIKPSVLQLTDDNNSLPGPSPLVSKKKRLSELFRESLGGDEFLNELNSSDPQKSMNGTRTAYHDDGDSSSSCERTPYKEMNGGENKSKYTKCCIPKMVRSWSFEVKRKKMSPG